MELIHKKLQTLREYIKKLDNVIVAYSGGVDSTLVLKICYEQLGENTIAVTSVSPSYPKHELDETKDIAKEIGVKHVLVETTEIEDPNYKKNSSDRCYFCKKNLYIHLERVAKEHGFMNIANGTNADDIADHRPGLKAATEYEIISPLLEVGITKKEVQKIARILELRNWNKPASPCLASRIPYGTGVNRQNLSMIGEAEAYLKEIGFSQLRVRYHGEYARIEVEQDEFVKMIKHSDQIVEKFKLLGFRYVTLDLAGFKSGRLNEVIAK